MAAAPTPAEDTSDNEIWLMYDGECPFCSSYVQFVRLRETIGKVELIDARAGDPRVAEVLAAGLDLDEGMVLKWQGKLYHGVDCINRLALLSTESGLFNRINAAIFRSETASKILYPILRAGRNTTLRLLGRRKLDLREQQI